MAFDKITAEDTNGKGVVGLPDTPQLDTTSMQKKFDELATDVIIPKFNKLVDDMSGNGAAGSTGAKVPEGLVAEQNIQAVLQALHDDAQTRQPKEAGKGLSTNDYTNEEKNTVQKNTNYRHTHENKSVLDLITSSVKSGYDRVVTMLSSVKRVATEVEASDESIPTGKAIVNFVQDMGGGDMSTSKYDPDKDGKVLKAEQADDTSLFAGQPPAYYAKADMVTKKYDSNAAYTKGQTCIQSDKIWRAKVDINTPEAWTEGHWEETSLEQIRAEMESEISSLNANLTSEDRINIKVNIETNSLNTPERTGVYYITGENIAGLPSGFSTYGLLFVMRSPYSIHPTNTNSVYAQLYIDVYNNRATRAFNSGAWTNWKNF